MKSNKKIFNIGFNKSGSSSLTKAMKLLGYKCAHYRIGEQRIVDLIRSNLDSNKSLLDSFNKFEFFSDFCGYYFYQELDRQYPESKFVLTIRDMEGWLESRAKHAMRNQNNPDYTYKLLNVNKEIWLKFREKYLFEITEYFKDRPNDLLVINIVEGEDWGKLCAFLKMPIPEIPFPNINKAIDKI